MAVPPVGARIEEVGRPDDGRAARRRMTRHRKLARHALGIEPVRKREVDRDAGDDGERPQVDEHVPGLAHDRGLGGMQTRVARHGDGRGDRRLRALRHARESSDVRL